MEHLGYTSGYVLFGNMTVDGSLFSNGAPLTGRFFIDQFQLLRAFRILEDPESSNQVIGYEVP